MDIAIQHTFLPHTDPDASMAFYCEALGFEVLNVVGEGTMRWVTIAPAGTSSPSIVLHPPAADPGITEDERNTIAQMMAKGTFATIVLTTPRLEETFDKAQATGAEVTQEPTDQPWGVRDCAFRDPAGNHVRINQAS
ncbi:glyoxalase [Knoellia sinensis KCTC 19936]|uniref:Glyoxalase n=1 Tax=Knoellia sinensis KCTC 19936 TaxID=1385520 RepID=A0A0A0JBH9_9MICO|nr:VOC family protein [Knoellia sinensis]KGN33372.1 glyoxalase [Knoellia sinensis KCTC 19936]